MAADLVWRGVAVIVGNGGAAEAAKAVTSTIPIVFSTGGDPVQAGLVASFNRPGGNLTGTVQFNDELIAKRLELMHELVPSATLVGFLRDPTTTTAGRRLAVLQEAADRIGQRLRVFDANGPEQFEEVFATCVREAIGALLVSNGTVFTNGRVRLTALAARFAIPTCYEYREFVLAGGLFSYGSSNAESYRQVGVYAGRILKGEKPGDLPIVQPTKFEFVLNLKIAKALGLNIPLKLHAFADEVIE
jgi:putative ABC transport system substrate-binding protein